MNNRELIRKVRRQLPRGEKMPKGKGWLLISPSGKIFKRIEPALREFDMG